MPHLLRLLQPEATANINMNGRRELSDLFRSMTFALNRFMATVRATLPIFNRIPANMTNMIENKFFKAKWNYWSF